jgi:flavin-dependent dehydrogenase
MIAADLFVDATGRSSTLSRIMERKLHDKKRKPPLTPLAVGFKAHLTGARTEPGVCEIFSFPGGYGGLTPVEGSQANLCFMMSPHSARRLGSDPETIVRDAVRRNIRAAHLLEGAEPVRNWLAVSVNKYGRSNDPAAGNLFTVGDAAAFIDPFTGSGMLMALESSALLAASINSEPRSAAAVGLSYRTSYVQAFSKRLRVCSVLRRAAFVPVLPSLVVGILKISGGSLRYLAGSVRTRNALGPKIV